jgi:putative aminopeptidase FrvX
MMRWPRSPARTAARGGAVAIAAVLAFAPSPGAAQDVPGRRSDPPFATSAPGAAGLLDSLAVRLAAMSAVTGYEDAMADTLGALLPGSRVDKAGNVVWSRGSGDPVRVAVCPMDEVGYVVGGIDPEGYLTLRRVGATPMGPLFDQWLEGQRVTVFGRRGPVPGVVAVRSTHLQRGRSGGPDEPFRLDDAWVDVGAGSPADVDALGVELLAPLTRAKRPHRYGERLLAAPFAVQRAACAALVAAVQRLPASLTGTAVAVFARRRHFGHDGAGFALGELAAGAAAERVVLLGGAAPADSLGAGAIAVGRDSIATGGGAQPVTAWSLAARYLRSPVETVSLADVGALAARLASFLGEGR